MEKFARPEIQARLARDNPWWTADGEAPERDLKRRVYFAPFKKLALNFEVKRAAVLLGPRRVGKTVLIKQLIQEAIEEGIPRKNALYVSIDTPIYSGISLEEFLSFIPVTLNARQRYLVAFDEIQYLRDWQTHLKDLVDSYPNVKFIASGSAAAALSLQSRESGAGRFSDFMLPPLTFSEFLDFTEMSDLITHEPPAKITCPDIEALNKAFIDYLNYGGYPEAVLNKQIRDNREQFIRSDIVEKVLLADLPNLYGIGNTQELNRLFTFLAYNTGNESSYEKVSRKSGISKPVVKKYIEYLESAFLIIKVPTINDTCRTLQRERNFKVYLNNPSMRAALFSPVEETDAALIGHLAESAVFAQWQHDPSFKQFRYARWRNSGEVDVVYLAHSNDRPLWIGEIKWSDQVERHFTRETKNLSYLVEKHASIEAAFMTTRTFKSVDKLGGRVLNIWPTAAYCYMVGRNVTNPDKYELRRSPLKALQEA
jgi:predicted AAA+ superfamily ATPase